jgi:hypothetical protein
MMGWISNKLFTGVVSLPLLFTFACGGAEDPAPAGIKSSELPELPTLVAEGEFPRGTARKPVDIRIALVGEVRGEIEPCGCPTLPYGGFTRRAVMLDRLRAKGPIFHLDAGELLLKGFSTDRSRDRIQRAAAMMKLSQEVGLDLWVPGPSDLLALGLEQIRSAPGPRRISATWTDGADKPLLPPTAVLERGGLRLGVVGLSAAIRDPSMVDQVRTLDPVEAAQAALLTLPEGLDLVIGLGNITNEASARVAAEVPGLAAILTIRGGQYSAPTPTTLAKADKAPVIEAPDRGRYLQVLTFRVGTGPGQPALVHPESRRWREREASGKEGPFEDLGRGRNLVGFATIPLGKDLDGGQTSHSGVDKALGQFKTRSLLAAAKRAQAKPVKQEHRYASSGSCVRCHSSEFARWSLSSHARAWRALVDRKQTANPECLPCHTTAWGKPSGLGELSTTSIRKFKSVQCESCHGPMGGHPEDTRVRSVPITKATCKGCHDEANSPDFDFAHYRSQATCQGGSPLPGVAP